MIDSTKVTPCNRRLCVRLVESETETTSDVLLPEGYKIKNSFETVEVIDMASDCENKANIIPGALLVVPGNVMENFTFNDEQYYLIQENYVLAIVEPRKH